jgi:hypothetical protein
MCCTSAQNDAAGVRVSQMETASQSWVTTPWIRCSRNRSRVPAMVGDSTSPLRSPG